MSVSADITALTPRGVESVTSAEALSAIHQPGTAAVLWRRQVLAGFQDWLNALPAEQLPRGRLILRPDAVCAAVTQLGLASGLPQNREAQRLSEDIAALAEIFATLMKAPYLRLRLEAVATNACRKFHVDALRARLVCTYRGSGTQFGTAAEGETTPRRVHSAPCGCPLLLRGSQWPETPPSGLLHRSPPIEGSGETRLLLVLDPVYDPDDAA